MKTFKSAKRAAEENAAQQPSSGGNLQEGENGAPYAVFDTEEEFIEAAREALFKDAPQTGVTSKVESRMQDVNRIQGGAAERDAEENDGGAKQLAGRWQEDARNLAAAVPEFDFAAALRNDTFTDALLKTGSVFEAYAAMTRPPYQRERGAIAQNALSPRRGTGESSVNPAKLSSEEFKRYIDGIKNR